MIIGGGNGLSVDNISVLVPALPIFELSLSGDVLELAWTSRFGAVYDVLSSTTLDTHPLTWDPWKTGILATPPLNNESFSMPSDPRRFFVLIER